MVYEFASRKSASRPPIIVVGAPRSGTKMLREMLKLHPHITGAQYEKEKVWCHGNEDRLNSSLRQQDLSPEIERFIQLHFQNASIKNSGKWIADKNVANSLRLEFVRAVFPGSPIIHIVRDGRDAVASSMERWKNPADLKYIIRNKAFPLEELPYFLKRQLKWKLEKILSKKRHVGWWGPKFSDMEELRAKYSLIELCGIQWKRCTEAALESLGKIEPMSFFQMKYEDVVSNPTQIMIQVFNFLGLSVDSLTIDRFCSYIKRGSIGRWQTTFSATDIDLLMNHIEETLMKLSYL